MAKTKQDKKLRLQPEKWKRIRFFPGYEVSTKGRVRSLKRRKPCILKPQTVTRGDRKKTYLRVTLYNKGGKRHRKIHRLVALAFKERVPGKNTVNHVDGNTHHNWVANLEWTTAVENTKHAWRTGLMARSVGARWRKRKGK
ncbi:hypothetical protein LCGC14_0399660 [marine sediment metagenome]|uniref:NUMOD4 domain-containing protein n=1 Tax=marine sediment metagenome TaxID=412755 RepID=A0A0F9T2Q7_9ZZZZ